MARRLPTLVRPRPPPARPAGAMNTAQFDGACGRCVRARGTEGRASGQWHLVKIVDHCPSCAHGGVDFSSTAFEAITGVEWVRAPGPGLAAFVLAAAACVHCRR